MLFGAYAPRTVDFAARHVVHLELAEEVRDGLPRVGPHAGVEAEFERIFDFFERGRGVRFLVVESRARDGEGFGLNCRDAALGFSGSGGDEELVQLGLVAFHEVIGGRDKFWLELVGGLKQFVFGVGGALLAFWATAAEQVLAAELSLAHAEWVGGVDVFDEELVAFADGFEGADEELGLVEDDEEVGVAGVVGAADEVVEAEAEGDVVEGAGEGDGVAVDLEFVRLVETFLVGVWLS